jgi:hypothetical protein
MKTRFPKFSVLSLCLLLATLAVTGMQIVNARQDRPFPPNPLTFLKRALEEASAPALTTQQEERLTTLITAFVESRQPPTPDATVKAAHDAYDAAILAGDAAAAQAQATTLANALAVHNAARLKAEASFKIDALEILTSAQKTALGAEELPRVLNILGGGPRGPGGPGRPGRGLQPGGPDGPPTNPAIKRRP